MGEASPDPRYAALDERIRTLETRVHRYEQIFENTPDVIVTADLEGRITGFNRGAEALFGYRREELLGTPVDRLYEDPRERARILSDVHSRGSVSEQDIETRHKDGRRIFLSASISQILGPDGAVTGTVGIAKDIGRRKALERQLQRLSITDKLTGLYNQAHFYQMLEVEKERSERLGHELALLFFDLDKFKEHNDIHGHLAGDAALRRIGSAIIGSIRKEVDSAYRYGGDEFMVLLPGADGETAAAFGRRLRTAIADLQIGLITASMGVAQYQRGHRDAQIVKRADAAMYRAKEAGGNTVCLEMEGA